MIKHSFKLNDTASNATVLILDKNKARPGFSGDFLETFFISENDKLKLLVGLGDKDLPVLQWQEVYATAAATLHKHKVDAFDIDLAPVLDAQGSDGIRNAVLGLVLGSYNFTLKKEDKREININLLLPESFSEEDAKSRMDEAVTLAEGIVMARDMTNMPSNLLHPEDMARHITGTLEPLGVECETISADRLKEMGMNGLFLIGDSSAYKPCLLVLRYLPLGSEKETLGLVGKGVAFDSGGYSLKPGASMMGMKSDMAGGASVAAVMYALAKNKVETNVIAVIPICENRVSESAMVPGDVYRSYSGKTVEVLNTDAEGRLILADAVSYIRKDEKVSRLIDIATLTGAVGAALGNGVTGVVSNNKDWWAKVKKASTISGERFHLLPDYPEYHKMLDSSIADVKNIGESYAGAITGGLFIGRFAEDTPWVHLDIAATSWMSAPLFAFQSKGATACGVTTLYLLCANANSN